jgi:hypothetical protein
MTLRFLSIWTFIGIFFINGYTIPNFWTYVPADLPRTDYLFVVDIATQTNYLFFKNSLIDQFSVSTGSKTRYSGNRSLPESVWRLGTRIDTNLAPIYGARLIYLDTYNVQKKQFLQTNRAFHGTNEPQNIGNPTSMGCVYHMDRDIIDIYTYIPEHTLVVSRYETGL